MTARAEGYWDQYGAPSIVDWCEPNYAVSPYVAEWWNTLSSVPMGFVGFLGMWLCWSNRHWLEPRFFLNFVAFAVVGWGSTAFHGTLLRIPQAADELPMVYSALVSIYILVLRRDFEDANPAKRQRQWGIGLSLFALGFTIAYWTTASWYFIIFLLIYGSLITYLTLRTLYLSYTAQNRAQMVRLCWAAFGMLSRRLLPHVDPRARSSFPANTPSSCFSPTPGSTAPQRSAPICGLVWAIADRLSQKGETPQFRWKPAPFIARK